MNTITENKQADSRARIPQRVDMDVIKTFPALMSCAEYASITGQTAIYVARMCSEGKLPAVKCGRAWRINKAKALEALGLA